jgi:putative ABC transport system permease protein
MYLFYISYRYLLTNWLNTLVNLLLIGLGVSILVVLLIGGKQSEDNFRRNLQGIDMVIGAKGSPQQIILSAVYHADYPTGNIKLADANKIAENKLVAKAIPLGLGDSYNGFRIVGTTLAYPQLYKMELQSGSWWQQPLEVCVGQQVASSLNLQLGSTFAGSHGLAENGESHEQTYKVVGILQTSNTVADRLILTDLQSVWLVHEVHEEEENKDSVSHKEQEQQEQHEQHKGHEKHKEAATEKIAEDAEITAMLLQFKSPLGNVMLPRLVNQTSNLQAAVPAMEVARLFLLIGTGTDFMQNFAYLLLFMGAFNVFVVFYNAMQARRYDIALLRTMGASALKTVSLLLLEVSLLAFAGILLGLLAGHASLELLNQVGEKFVKLNPYQFYIEELFWALAVWALALLAAFLPAVQVYQLQVGEVLKKG